MVSGFGLFCFIAEAAMPFFRAGMGFVVNFRQVLEIQMGVDLRGGNIAVTKQFLDRPEILARFQQVAGKGMPQHMRVDVRLRAFRLTPAA